MIGRFRWHFSGSETLAGLCTSCDGAGQCLLVALCLSDLVIWIQADRAEQWLAAAHTSRQGADALVATDCMVRRSGYVLTVVPHVGRSTMNPVPAQHVHDQSPVDMHPYVQKKQMISLLTTARLLDH